MNSLRTSVLVAAIAAAVALPGQAADSYTVDPGHTYPSFEIGHLGFSTQRGRFNKTSGKITLDRAGKSGSVDLTIDATSIDTGNPKLADHLKSDDFFGVGQFPTITFKSTAFKFDGDKLSAVDGNLTLHGVTKPVTLVVSHFNCGAHPFTKKELCGADASVGIKRSDFGIKYGLPAIADDVKLLINVEAFKD
jgi:polyisoprenoid-binding protein YceI